MVKIYGVLVNLYDKTANKIKENLFKIRAFQINLLTKPYFVAEYRKSTLAKPSIEELLNKTVNFKELLEAVDTKTKNKINQMLARALDIATTKYNEEKSEE